MGAFFLEQTREDEDDEEDEYEEEDEEKEKDLDGGLDDEEEALGAVACTMSGRDDVAELLVGAELVEGLKNEEKGRRRGEWK